jgi:fatty aldehyde decarbonylase
MGCGRNLGIKPDLGLARRLFAPLHELFLTCNQQGDLPGCLVIQGLIVECFALASYHAYLPVADAYAQPITAAVISDEGEHLGYAERWLHAHFSAAQTSAGTVSRKALPITLSILQTLAKDLKSIGMDPHEVLASFNELFLQALEASGFDQTAARHIVTRALAAAAPS